MNIEDIRFWVSGLEENVKCVAKCIKSRPFQTAAFTVGFAGHVFWGVTLNIDHSKPADWLHQPHIHYEHPLVSMEADLTQAATIASTSGVSVYSTFASF